MKVETRVFRTAALFGITLAFTCTDLCGQVPVIELFSVNGELVCKGLKPGSKATIEWAPSVTGPWSDSWTNLAEVLVDTNGTIRVKVPMFYRVRGEPEVEAPAGMVLIPGGWFQMGDTLGEGDQDEQPAHAVCLSPFYMDQTPVTHALWCEVYEWAVLHGYQFDNPGSAKGTNYPVYNLNWYDCVKWCNARSEKEGRVPAYYTDASHSQVYRTGRLSIANNWVKWNAGYRLPTEAEWERAARGGLEGMRFPWGSTIDHTRANYYSYWEGGRPYYPYDVNPYAGYHPAYAIGDQPWTNPVKSFGANGYGLYDMAGNVGQWCWDWWDGNYYRSSAVYDPKGPLTGSDRVIRGGGWCLDAKDCRVTERRWLWPDIGWTALGFRCVLPATQSN